MSYQVRLVDKKLSLDHKNRATQNNNVIKASYNGIITHISFNWQSGQSNFILIYRCFICMLVQIHPKLFTSGEDLAKHS